MSESDLFLKQWLVEQGQRFISYSFKEAESRCIIRTALFFIVAIASMFTMDCKQAVDIEVEKTAIGVVLDNYITSVENEDIKLYGENLVHDSEMMNFGAFGNPIVGWEALEKLMENQNEALSESKITASDVSIRIEPSGKLA